MGPLKTQFGNLTGVQWLGADIYDMHGRTVRISETANAHECADCYASAKYRIHEQTFDDPWYWCGVCDIGG